LQKGDCEKEGLPLNTLKGLLTTPELSLSDPVESLLSKLGDRDFDVMQLQFATQVSLLFIYARPSRLMIIVHAAWHAITELEEQYMREHCLQRECRYCSFLVGNLSGHTRSVQCVHYNWTKKKKGQQDFESVIEANNRCHVNASLRLQYLVMTQLV
jgi:hypothetical protein